MRAIRGVHRCVIRYGVLRDRILSVLQTITLAEIAKPYREHGAAWSTRDD